MNQPHTEPNYIVLRPSPDLPDGYMPNHLDGQWLNLHTTPRHMPPPDNPEPMHTTMGEASPTGRFETRDDGAVAEVWEIRPPHAG